MRVPRNYLNTVVAPLVDHRIGAVTCLYSGSPRGGIVSTLIAMFINEWFLPSVLVSQSLKNNRFCFGATMVVRRDVLAQIGGFIALADYLADDYMLGKLVAEHGHKIHLSHLVVENVIHETSLKSMFFHELRWARTMRTAQPLGYLFTFLTDTLMIGFVAGIAAYAHTQQLLWPVIIIGTIFSIRALFHLRIQSLLNSRNAGSVWLIPVRDFLTFCVRLASFAGNRIEWKDKSFSVNNTGLMFTIASQKTDIAQVSPGIKEPELKTVNTNTAEI
jgi:ceramide glucosyltransferase